MPKFGVSIYSISRKIVGGEMTASETIKWLAQNGAECIELVPFGIDMLDPTEVEAIAIASKQANIPIVNYSLNANFLQISEAEYQEEITRVKSHINVAAKLGITTIRVDSAGYRRPIETNTIENFHLELQQILETYRNLCEYAAEQNMQVLLENHGFHINGGERVGLIMSAMADVKNFGLQLDVGNFECVDDRAEIATKKLLPYATTIHMKDFYIRDRDPGDATEFDCSGAWFRSVSGKYLRGAILGQGDLDMYKIMGDIKKSGFDGYIILEFEGLEDCLYGTKVGIDNMRRIYHES